MATPTREELLAQAARPGEEALRLHPRYRGKIQMLPRCPEIWPWDAREAGARIVATGRSDFPNQLNNSLVFPGLFRGTLDVRARTISDEMAIAVAHEIAGCVDPAALGAEAILPRMDDDAVHLRVAVAAAMTAQSQGLARVAKSRDAVLADARHTMRAAREATRVLMREGLIA